MNDPRNKVGQLSSVSLFRPDNLHTPALRFPLAGICARAECSGMPNLRSFRSEQARGIAAALALALQAPAAGQAASSVFHIAKDGNDAWSGSLARPNAAKTDGPLASLTAARDAIRKLKAGGSLPQGGVEVIVGGGDHILTGTIEFTKADSGSKESRIVYRAATGAKPRFLAGKIVSNWRPVTNESVLGQLDESARGKVVQADLRALGISDFGSPGGGGLELFFNGNPMTVSRWPNEGFSPVVKVLGATERDVRGTKGCAEGIFEYEGDRPKRWAGEKDAWVHGYWFWDWAEQRHRVKSIDAERRVIEVQPPYHNYGYRKGQWFYAFNLLSEIDQPGEWQLDRETGALYFWPPAPIKGGEAVVSLLKGAVSLKDTSHVTLRGFTFEATRGTAISMSGGEGNLIDDCAFLNLGAWAVNVSGGKGHGVTGCDMSGMGGGGIVLSGGDRKTLTPAGHFAVNNHIHHYARVKRVYQPGIQLRGVGNRAANNLIHDAPHMGMGFSGNDHLIELNEIHHVCEESNDAGAIYTGRNWTMRGTIIRHNYLHDISGFRNRGCVGVYLDDMFCGTEISGNLFHRVTRAAFIGGGRDCLVRNNLFVDCKPALHIDARALGWAHGHADMWIKEGREQDTLSGIRYKETPYSVRYPELVGILDDEPAAPKGNRVTRNVSFGGTWDGVHGSARKYPVIENNLVDADPHFATPDRLGEGSKPRPEDFALKADSPAWKLGFEKLPLERMGLLRQHGLGKQ